MIAGETFMVDILKIHHVEEGKRIVFVTMDTICYAKQENVTIAFWKSDWDKIKAEGQYLDNKPIISLDYARRIEAMDDCAFCKTYTIDLSTVSDRLLADEINRRIANGSFTFEYLLEYRVSSLKVKPDRIMTREGPKSKTIQLEENQNE